MSRKMALCPASNEIMTEVIPPEQRAAIEAKLDEIEREENVQILMAIESGSRAWGFHSPDSDFDVRFIYARPREWHYRLGKKRDVIERPINDELDISGWELGKALPLVMNSNAVVAEWLQSPVVYRRNDQAVQALTDFAAQALDRKSVTWHYVSLFARQETRLSHPDGGIRFKRWFYMLRPAMALRWMRVNDTAMPPMNMADLRAGCDLPDDIEQCLDDVIARKMTVRETDRIDHVDARLDALIREERDLAKTWLKTAKTSKSPELWDKASDLHMTLSLSVF